MEYVDFLEANNLLNNKKFLNKFACVDPSRRTNGTAWGKEMNLNDKLLNLRSGNQLAVIELGVPRDDKQIIRHVYYTERLEFQGTRLEHCRGSTPTQIKKWAGQAFPVPMAAAVIFKMQIAMQDAGIDPVGLGIPTNTMKRTLNTSLQPTLLHPMFALKRSRPSYIHSVGTSSTASTYRPSQGDNVPKPMSSQLANSLPVNSETTSDEDGGYHVVDCDTEDVIVVDDISDQITESGTSEDNFVMMHRKTDLHIKLVVHYLPHQQHFNTKFAYVLVHITSKQHICITK